MTNREQVITTLTEHLDHWKRLLSEGVCTKEEGEKTINALTFAIESIKVDRAYDLAYEKVDFIEIPDNATWGDVIEAVFPNIEKAGVLGEFYRIFLEGKSLDDFSLKISEALWNSPYRKEQE